MIEAYREERYGQLSVDAFLFAQFTLLFSVIFLKQKWKPTGYL